MRVLLAIPCLERGGTEMQTLQLAKALLAAGHRVEVVCYFETDRQVVDEFIECGCLVELLRLQRGLPALDFIRIMRRYFRAARPDVLHVQYMTPGALTILAGRLAGVPKVLATVHQPYTASHGVNALRLLRASSMLCDRFIAVSQVAEASWFGSSCDCSAALQKGGRRRHCTIHNAVDVRAVAALVDTGVARKYRETYGIAADAFVFGYIGRLSHEKGVDNLLQAFGQVFGRTKGISLLVVGDGPEKQKLQERFSHEAWWRGIVFAGTLSWKDAMRHLSAMDCLVVPSRFEGFGLSAVEAMAASRPVIASRTGGLSEIITHGRDGFLYEPEDVSALAGQMCLLADDKQLCRNFSMSAFRRSQDFDVEPYSRKIQDLYNTCQP